MEPDDFGLWGLGALSVAGAVFIVALSVVVVVLAVKGCDMPASSTCPCCQKAEAKP